MLDYKKELVNLIELEERAAGVQWTQQDGNEFQAVFADIGKTMSRFNKKQMELSLQIDELSDALEEENSKAAALIEKAEGKEKDNKNLVKSLVEVTDMIEDFYVYTLSTDNPQLQNQSRLIWNKALKEMGQAGIFIINDKDSLFNPELNTVLEIVNDSSLGNNQIVSVARSGYTFNNQVIRKSTVVVNKTEEE